MKISDDALVIQRIKNGDKNAFDEIVESYSDMVYNTVFYRVRSKEDAEDLTQETFIKLWKSLGSFREECRLSTYIYRIAVNVCIDHLRKASQREAESLSAYDENGEYSGQTEIPDPTASASPEKALEETELRSEIRRGIALLPPEQREVIILRDVLGDSYANIAEKLGVPDGTVKSRLVRARIALKKYLTERNFYPSYPSNETGSDENGKA